MTMQDAIAQQPQWVQLWVNWMAVGVFLLPLGLLVWRQSRIAGLAILASNAFAALGTYWIFLQLGYVKLIGLAHIILWTPLGYYLWLQVRRHDMPKWPRWILIIALATIVMSLLFDYTDSVRYLLGERAPLASQ